MKFRESHLTEYSRLLRLTAAALFLAAGVGSTQAGALADLYYGYTLGITGNAVTNLTQDPTFPKDMKAWNIFAIGMPVSSCLPTAIPRRAKIAISIHRSILVPAVAILGVS